jgi:hypothetical protein
VLISKTSWKPVPFDGTEGKETSFLERGGLRTDRRIARIAGSVFVGTLKPWLITAHQV